MNIARLSLCSIIFLMLSVNAFGLCTCSPGMKSGYSISTEYTVYLDPSLSSAAADAAMSAIQQWNGAMTNYGESPMFSLTSNASSASIIVYEDPALRGSTTGGQFNPGTIAVNPDYDGRGDFMKQVMLHEVGHAAGFTDVYTSGCDSQTVMYGAIDPNASGYMTQLGGDDSCAVDREWDRYNRELLRPACVERCTQSPIIINFDTGAYRLSGADSPVLFDISNEGHVRRIGWTAAGAEEAFLCLDRNGDGQITNGSELFGNATPLKDGSVADNGFQALAEFDDNHDGVIDSRDSIWTRLLLWTDTNHDGISQGSELTPVSNSPLAGIALGYHWTGRRDSSGNVFRYESNVWIQQRNGAATPRPVYDIFFISVP